LKKREKFRIDHQRASVADEAARIIQEEGLNDFRSAKEKAVERLRLQTTGPLPSNGEIERALAERNRIFRGDRHLSHLRNLRHAAMRIMRSLSTYNPRLVGPVLSGHTTEYSSINLHLFNDSAEAVGIALEVLEISYRVTQFRHQLRRGKIERFPGYRFNSEEHEFSLTVFPELCRHNSPLSPVDRRPMPRADLRELERLLGA
jgi:hypothetical protein